MVFSSLLFLLIFLPLCIIVYYTAHYTHVAKDGSNIVANRILLVFSIAFYAFGGAKYLALISGVILFNWCMGFGVCPGRHKEGLRKLSLVVGVIGNIGVLFFFKYFNLSVAVVENLFYAKNSPRAEIISNILNGVGNGALGFKEIVLPIGISFYIFQAMSYVIDVYRGEALLQIHVFDFALYIAFFPQLIAGPIVQYKDIEEQIHFRTESADLFALGIRRFCFGLAKKVFIANTMGELVDSIWALEVDKLAPGLAWLGALAYSFQIYYDFSAYSDMAIGLGKMFGFEFKENFNLPYQAESIQDFWRRWHISLSTWFRNYVYIPLGGSFCSKGRLFFNIFIVFLLTGIWHGANWTFVFWGVAYGVLLIIERAGLGDLLKKNRFRFLNRLLTFIIVTLLWVVFRADSLPLAFTYIKNMFVKQSSPYRILNFLNAKVLIGFGLSVLFAGLIQRIPIKRGKKILNIFSYIAAFVLLILSIIMLVNGTYNPFIYFQF